MLRLLKSALPSFLWELILRNIKKYSAPKPALAKIAAQGQLAS